MLRDSSELTPIVEGCKSCFMCRFICTSARTLNTEKDTPRGRSLLLSMIRRGSLAYTPDVADALYSCCLCAHCRTSCMSHYDFPAVAVAARKDLAAAGLLPPALAAARDSLTAHNNPYGMADPDPALKAAMAALPPGAETLLLLGPDARHLRPAAALAAISALRKLGIACACLEQEPTSAYLLHEIGASGDSAKKRDILIAAVKKSGARQIICLDPRAYCRMQGDAAFGGIGVRHFIEVVAGHAGKLKPAAGAFSWHDADFLVRWADLREQTDSLLRALGDYTPPYWRGREARSLGSVTVALYKPEFTRELARIRIEDFAELGAAKVLCATADDMAALADAAAAKGIALEHIAEAVDAAL